MTSSTIANIFDPYLDNTYPDRASVGGSTNWEAAFQETFDQLTNADAVIFITDGNPNTYLNENIDNTPIFDADDGFVPVNEAIRPANLIKENGTHIYAIGITSGVNTNTLFQVAEGASSTQFDGLNAALADYDFITSFSSEDLATALVGLARGICSAADPNLLLVKRITAVNPGTPDEIRFDNFVDDPSTPNDNDSNWPDSDGDSSNSNNIYLRGRIDAVEVKPGDEIEYTIYFLSNGSEDASNVTVCDVIPSDMSFVKNTYGVEAGIGLGLDSNSLPTSPNILLSNLLNDDRGNFYDAGTDPPSLCQKNQSDPPHSLISVNSSNNDSGALLVQFDNPLPRATDPGVPTNSYGFIRFRTKVK